ncbi:MAG: aminotransferase class III-fold pyridoxal phosphate-dependent enzyme, partial [Bacteroidota bacterium]
FIPAPLPGDEERSFAALQSILEGGDVAAFIFEPLIQGSGGMRMFTPMILDKMVEECQKHQVLTIADEVMVGFYRTGKFFACDHLTHKPDIYCLSKGLTGGTTALGMTTCNEKIYQAFYADDKMKTLFHGHSCTANPMACTVGLASLDLLESDECQGNIRRIIKRHEAFREELEQQPMATNIRQTGVILAFDVDNGEQTSYFNSIRDTMWHFCMSKGVILRPLGNTLYVLPPYVITDEQLDKVYQTIRELFVHLKNH